MRIVIDIDGDQVRVHRVIGDALPPSDVIEKATALNAESAGVAMLPWAPSRAMPATLHPRRSAREGRRSRWQRGAGLAGDRSRSRGRRAVPDAETLTLDHLFGATTITRRGSDATAPGISQEPSASRATHCARAGWPPPPELRSDFRSGPERAGSPCRGQPLARAARRLRDAESPSDHPPQALGDLRRLSARPCWFMDGAKADARGGATG